MGVSAGRLAAAACAMVLAPAFVAAQSAECAAQPCSNGSAGPRVEELWAHAARAHERKLEFVAALRDFTRAQTGGIGDEGDALRVSLDAMRRALGSWDRAIGSLETAVAGVRRTADVHVALATVYLDRDRPAEALRELADAERLAARRVDVHTLRAHAYARLGRPADAARALQAAAALDPRPTIVYWQAQQWRRAATAATAAGTAAGDLQRARRPADARAADAAGSDPVAGAGALEADLQAGLALRRFVDLVAAAPGRIMAAKEPFERADLFRQAAGVAPVFPVGLYADGYAALDRGEYREALSLFARGVERDPLTRAAPAVRQTARVAGAALRRGETADAIERLQELVAERPTVAEGHRVLAAAYAIDGQPAASVAHFERAMRLDPADERARSGLAAALVAEGRVADAEHQLVSAAEQFPQSRRLRYELGRLYESQARYTDAIAALEASRSPGPIVGRDYLHLAIGRQYVNRSEFEHAVSAYVERIDVNPNHADGHRQLAEIYFLQGRDAEALAEFTATAFLDTADARAYVGAGQVYVRMGDHVKAVAALSRALDLGATDAQTRYLLGLSLVRVGRTEDGHAHIAASQRLQAEAMAEGREEFQRRTVRREAEEALAAGNHATGVALFEQLIARQAVDMTEDMHQRLAAAYSAIGRYDDATHHRETAERLRAERRQRRMEELAGTP